MILPVSEGEIILNKNRLEAFTDAIIAIAATIMVLDLHIPKHSTFEGLLSDWSVFLAYIISFTLIYTVWSSHHDIFEKAKYISIKTFLYNGLWLFFLTLVPFATNWVGTDPTATAAEVTYSVVLLLWSFSFQLMDVQISHDNPGVRRDHSSQPWYRIILYSTYIAGMVVAFFAPLISLLIIGIMSVTLTISMLTRNYRQSA